MMKERELRWTASLWDKPNKKISVEGLRTFYNYWTILAEEVEKLLAEKNEFFSGYFIFWTLTPFQKKSLTLRAEIKVCYSPNAKNLTELILGLAPPRSYTKMLAAHPGEINIFSNGMCSMGSLNTKMLTLEEAAQKVVISLGHLCLK